MFFPLLVLVVQKVSQLCSQCRVSESDLHILAHCLESELSLRIFCHRIPIVPKLDEFSVNIEEYVLT